VNLYQSSHKQAHRVGKMGTVEESVSVLLPARLAMRRWVSIATFGAIQVISLMGRNVFNSAP